MLADSLLLQRLLRDTVLQELELAAAETVASEEREMLEFPELVTEALGKKEGERESDPSEV